MKFNLLSILLMVLLSGCSSVVSQNPVGLEIISINPKEWDGTWFCDGSPDVVKIKVIDESNGIVQLALIEEGSNELKFKSIIFQMMKGKKWIYANVLEWEGEKAKDEYFWGKITNERGKITFWWPSVNKFSEAAESHKINAIVHRKAPSTNGEENPKNELPDSVTLQEKPETIVDLIEEGESNFFEWEKPISLTRLFK